MISADDLAALRSETQRYRIFCVPFGTFQARSYTTINQTKSVATVDDADWQPVLNLGTHRIAFVDEAISFDALRSFYRGEGLGAGTVTGGDWTFEDADTPTASGIGPHSVSWDTPGLYDVTYTVGTTMARRYVRVLASRDESYWDLVNISGLSGDVNQGWGAQITIMPNDDNGVPVSVSDYQCVGIFVEDLWGPSGTMRVIGAYDPDPKLVMMGYVKTGTVQVDANTHSVTFVLESIAGQLKNIQVHKTACWFGTTPTSFGTEFTGIGEMKITDPPLWLLQYKTNILQQHDYYSFWNGTLQSLETIEGAEASCWSVLDSWAKSNFLLLYADAGNGIRFAPDRQVVVDNDWESEFPVRFIAEESLLSLCSLNENKQRNVIYVQVVATDTKRQRQKVGEYPNADTGVIEGPPVGPGSWIKRKDLLGNSQAWVDQIAERLYLVANRKWTGSLNFFLNRACHPGDLIELTFTLEDRGLDWIEKLFLVESVSYDIDPAQNIWKTTIRISEDVI